MVLRKRGNRWQVDGYIDGRRRITSFQNKAEAELYKRELKLRTVGCRSAFVAVGCKDAIRKYFDLVSSQKSKATKKNEKKFFETFFEYFGDIPVNEIGLLRLEEFRRQLLNSISAASVNRLFNCYRHFFRQCLDWELIERNPTARLTTLRIEVKPRELWSDQQIEKVLSNAAPWAADAFFFLALTAARAGEVTRLKWENVNIGSDPHVILRSLKGNGTWRERAIPLAGPLLEFVSGKRAEGARAFRMRPQDEVFRNAAGNPISPTHLSREMGRLTRKLKMAGLTLHGLRHTFLTKMVESDLSLEKVRQIAGHSNLKTLQQYLHVRSSSLNDAMEKAVGERVIRFPMVTSGNK